VDSNNNGISSYDSWDDPPNKKVLGRCWLLLLLVLVVVVLVVVVVVVLVAFVV